MNQNELPLPCNPGSEENLRRAYQASALPGLNYSFERAMRDPAMRRCLRNVAEALLKPFSYRPRIEAICPACGAKHTGPFTYCSPCKSELDRGQ